MISEIDAKELLGMLTANVRRLSVERASGVALMPEDVAHALGTIRDDGAALLARVKYAGETGRAEQLVGILFRRVAVALPIEGWPIPRRDFLRDLCRLALVEIIDAHTCLWCGGTGQAVHHGGKIACGACDNGRRRVRDADRAELVDCSVRAWSRHWADRYADIRRIVEHWDMLLGRVLRDRLAGA